MNHFGGRFGRGLMTTAFTTKHIDTKSPTAFSISSLAFWMRASTSHVSKVASYVFQNVLTQAESKVEVER